MVSGQRQNTGPRLRVCLPSLAVGPGDRSPGPENVSEGGLAGGSLAEYGDGKHMYLVTAESWSRETHWVRSL